MWTAVLAVAEANAEGSDRVKPGGSVVPQFEFLRG